MSKRTQPETVIKPTKESKIDVSAASIPSAPIPTATAAVETTPTLEKKQTIPPTVEMKQATPPTMENLDFDPAHLLYRIVEDE